MANDGTLNQRESGVGIFDQLTFQNDTPIGGEAEKEEESRQAHEAAYGDNQPAPEAEQQESEPEPAQEFETQSDGSMFGFGSEETQQAFDEAEGITPLEVEAETAQEFETQSDGSMFGFGSEETQQAFDEAEQQEIEQGTEPAAEQELEAE